MPARHITPASRRSPARRLAIAAAIAGITACACLTHAQTDTSITYQGRLAQNGVPLGASDTPEMTFELFSAPTGGVALGTVTLPAVSFSNGVFSVDLDFGDDAFQSTATRWLEITVDGNTLSPRQRIAPTPYSLSTRGIFVDDSGNIGIQTTDTVSPLTVGGSVRITDGSFTSLNPNNNAASFNFNWFNDTPRLRLGGIGAGANGGFDIQRVGDQSIFRILDNGDVGLREPNPDLRFTIEERGNGIEYFSGERLGIFTNSAERMRFDSNGNIGINDSTPDNTLSVNGGGDFNALKVGSEAIQSQSPLATFEVVGRFDVLGSFPLAGGAYFDYADGQGVPGSPPATTLPTVRIRRVGGLNFATALEVESEGDRAAQFISDGSNETVNIVNQASSTALHLVSGGINDAVLDINMPGSISSSDFAVFRVGSNNQIRFSQSGRGFFDGGTQTGGADVAEWFAVDGDRDIYEPGDLLVISTETDRAVRRSAEPYSTLIAGVYATRPGVLLTERDVDADHSDMVPMGVVGVIPTKVSLENGPIRRGDMLVSSSIPGHAMKGTDRGRMLGAIVGRALEPADGSQGDTAVIKVMVAPR